MEGRLRLAESRERQRVKGASTRGQPAAVGAAAPVGKAAPVTAQASEEERAAAEKAANANMAKLLEEEDALKVCCQGLKLCLCSAAKRFRLGMPILVDPRWRVIGSTCPSRWSQVDSTDCLQLAAFIPALHSQQLTSFLQGAVMHGALSGAASPAAGHSADSIHVHAGAAGAEEGEEEGAAQEAEEDVRRGGRRQPSRCL